MKLFKYTSGLDVHYGVAENEKDAYDRRAEIDPTYDFIGCHVEEVVVQGYTITVKADKK